MISEFTFNIKLDDGGCIGVWVMPDGPEKPCIRFFLPSDEDYDFTFDELITIVRQRLDEQATGPADLDELNAAVAE